MSEKDDDSAAVAAAVAQALAEAQQQQQRAAAAAAAAEAAAAGSGPVLYSQRADWADVQPVLQDEGPHPVCAIGYSPEFADAMNYFRAIIKAQEKSVRALRLTADVLMLNPANYTAWQYRREILNAIPFDEEEEQEFVDEAAESNPKNYQIWHHRQWLLLRRRVPELEIAFLDRSLVEDAKNYHAWSHRQFVVSHFDLWERELPQCVERLLVEDPYNNSAWNHRYFIVTRNNTVAMNPEVQMREVEFAVDWALRVPVNESSWNYLRGIVLPIQSSCTQEVAPATIERVRAACDDQIQRDERHETNQPCTHAMALRADLVLRRLAEASPVEVERARGLYEQLAGLDPVRARLWQRKRSQLLPAAA